MKFIDSFRSMSSKLVNLINNYLKFAVKSVEGVKKERKSKYSIL